MDSNKYFVDVLYIMPALPPYDFSVPSTAESQKRTVAALIGSAAAQKAQDKMSDDQRKMYNSLSDEEKFVYYNLSPDDRVKFDETMTYSGLNNFINASGRSGGRKSRRSRRSRKTKRRRSRHR